ncbi:MAG: DNA-binding domain-containing protein [Planctomycetota bacterium]|nr:DNA-binding domain-containing protein [Planctomycetota bacterium]
MNMKAPPTLKKMENWLLEIIRHPNIIALAIDSDEVTPHRPDGVQSVDDAIGRSKYLTAEQRLGVYANMYFWRLIDILADHFEVIQGTMGHDMFFNVARSYLIAHPSSRPTLYDLGSKFVTYLESQDDFEIPNQEFCVELARLEDTIEQIFHADQSTTLVVEELVKIPTESWGNACFECVAALQLHAFEYPVNRYWQSYQNTEEDEKPEVPGKGSSWVAVVRRDYVVWRYNLDEAQYTLLKAFQSGKSLNDAIFECANLPGIDLGELTQSLTAWFQEWTADGFFSTIRVDEDAESEDKD